MTHIDDSISEAERKKSSPDAEDSRKPGSPTDLTKRSWTYVGGKTFREFLSDQCTDLAAALTYYSVLAVAPALLALISILGLVGNSEKMVGELMNTLEEFVPEDAAKNLQSIIEGISQSSASTLAFYTGLAVALWSASNYVNAFGRAMNRIYEIDEGRPIWKLRPVMLLVTLITLVLVALIALMLVASGPVAEAIGSFVGLSDTFLTVWSIAKWPAVLVLVVIVIAILYYGTPNVRQPKFRWISLGAVVAIGVWALASAGFAFYVARFSNYDATYGALAGVVIFLLWLWITNLALLFGAELDAELERGRQLQAGIAAEETVQLPPRDTQASEKKAEKFREDVERGRELRESRGTTDGAHKDKGSDKG
ncbi:YihY/virulence factor BrkB family protein [Sanguibacter suaedae]|uniref:YihY/virulence factor BrkB family protein n=1 Tax=Sanguibacter suaedae TaxID=2795737 RepID=A0A934I3G6_9MICO|nr:YihY/virulence factor BrkB family protein [Sanguibacter suaedae]MBI9113536.1 YihY/virulence factor BrkB family protein [Sanguibacter suaedae]